MNDLSHELCWAVLSYGGDSANGHNFDGSCHLMSATFGIFFCAPVIAGEWCHANRCELTWYTQGSVWKGGSFRALLGQVSEDVNVNTWPRISECAVALLPESIKGLLLHRCASGFDLPEDFVHFSRVGAFESKVNRARFRGEPHKIHKYRPLQTYLSHLAETKFGHIFQLKTMQKMRKKQAEMRSKAAWKMKNKSSLETDSPDCSFWWPPPYPPWASLQLFQPRCVDLALLRPSVGSSAPAPQWRSAEWRVCPPRRFRHHSKPWSGHEAQFQHASNTWAITKHHNITTSNIKQHQTSNNITTSNIKQHNNNT